MCRLTLLVALMVVLYGRQVVGTGCVLSEWPSWHAVDLEKDSTAKELAKAALKDYVEGLEQASSDLQCFWANVTTDVKAACTSPDDAGKYAMEFSYMVPCKAGEERNAMEDLVLSGIIEGVLPASSPEAESDVKAANTRSLLSKSSYTNAHEQKDRNEHGNKWDDGKKHQQRNEHEHEHEHEHERKGERNEHHRGHGCEHKQAQEHGKGLNKPC